MYVCVVCAKTQTFTPFDTLVFCVHMVLGGSPSFFFPISMEVNAIDIGRKKEGEPPITFVRKNTSV